MDPVPVTGSHPKPGSLLASAKAAGDHGNGLASRPAGYEQPFRNRGAPMPGVRPHTGGKRFVCLREGCGRWFSRSGHLQQHLRVHTGEKPFVCPHENCRYASAIAGSLRVHLRAHSGEKPFVCSWEGCEYASAASGYLKQHLRVHKGEKPFVCPWEDCGYASAISSNLRAHVRRHSGEKTFVCPWEGCGGSFAHSDNLKKHWRIHSGEKPFDCPWEGCGYASATSGNLKAHQRCHSGKKTFVYSHAGGGPAVGGPGSRVRHLRRCATAGSWVRLRKDSTSDCRSSGASSGHFLARAKSPSCFQNPEAGQPLPVTTQYPPSTGSTTEVSRLDAGVGLNLDSGRQRQRTGVCSDSPHAMATASSGVCAFFDRSLDPSDRHQLQSPGLNLSPASPPSTAQFDWEQSPSATGGMSDWLTGSTDHTLFDDWLPSISTHASDKDVPAFLLTDDDKAFWQALISPAHGEQ